MLGFLRSPEEGARGVLAAVERDNLSRYFRNKRPFLHRDSFNFNGDGKSDDKNSLSLRPSHNENNNSCFISFLRQRLIT